MTNHEALMRRAMHMAETARLHARPNPWVGAVLVCANGAVHEGVTQSPGNAHAEIVALQSATRSRPCGFVLFHLRCYGCCVCDSL